MPKWLWPRFMYKSVAFAGSGNENNLYTKRINWPHFIGAGYWYNLAYKDVEKYNTDFKIFQAASFNSVSNFNGGLRHMP